MGDKKSTYKKTFGKVFDEQVGDGAAFHRAFSSLKQVRAGLALLVILLGLGILTGGITPAKAQSGAEIGSVRVGHDFGKEIRFRVAVQSADPIQKVSVRFRDERELFTRVEAMSKEGDDFIYLYDASQNLLSPFAKLTVSFLVLLENGTEISSENYAYTYSDNRFAWQSREDGYLRVHWNNGDEVFSQAALDVTRNSFKRISEFFPTEDAPLDVYIYASPADLQNALSMGGENWVAGHADPALGIVFVSVAPGLQAQILMQQQIPHELAHVLLYRYVGEGYERLPTWLQEGIASLAELYPNADYPLALERAERENALIPISQLCLPFSRDASQAFLSYAEAASFTRYLRDTYGASKLDALIRTYADGVGCETGVQQVYGQSLTYLEARWQESALSANLGGVALRALAPYLIILGIFLLYPLASFFAVRKGHA